jgi:hypothetical protein
MVQLDQLKALASDLRRKLKQVDQLTGRSGERDRDARRKRDVRATAKEVFIPGCEDRDRRERLERSDDIPSDKSSGLLPVKAGKSVKLVTHWNYSLMKPAVAFPDESRHSTVNCRSGPSRV